MLNDTLANTMSTILQDEKLGRIEATIRPSSVIIKRVLDVLQEHGYIKSYEEVKDGKGDVLKVRLSGNINKCGVIKPRYSVKTGEFERFEKRFLLAKDMGVLIVSTPQGILTHEDAKKKNIGGRLIAYCY